jgi:hypothetical protein
MSTNYTNYHELKEQDKDSVQTKIKYQTPKQPPLYNPNPRQSVPFIRVYLREPFDTGSGAQGWQSPFATETGGLSQTGNSVASAEQTSAALETSSSGYILCHPGQACLTRDPMPRGVAKSVCHRDRRSPPSRQLSCLCQTDFGSPRNKSHQTTKPRHHSL